MRKILSLKCLGGGFLKDGIFEQQWHAYRRNKQLRVQHARYVQEVRRLCCGWEMTRAGSRKREMMDSDNEKHTWVSVAQWESVSLGVTQTLVWLLRQWETTWVFAQTALSFLICKMRLIDRRTFEKYNKKKIKLSFIPSKITTANSLV